MSLVHGQAISAEEIERIVSREFTPQEFASLCNAIAWASAGHRCSSLPSFTERVNVADGGIDAEWQTELPDDQSYSSPLLGSGWNVFQYKKRDIFAQGRDKTFSNLKAGLKGAVKDLYERTKRRPNRYVLFTNLDLTHPTQDQKPKSRTKIPQKIIKGQKEQLKEKILEGYDQPDGVQVEIVGAAELSSFLNSLPQLRSAFFCTSEFSTWEKAWQSHTSEKILGANVKLIGREQELTDLRSYIDDSGIRAVVISGAPDIGKTRLALEATNHRPIETVVAVDPRSMSVKDLLTLESRAMETIIIIEDPDPDKAEEFVKQAFAHTGLKLLITLPIAEDAPIPNFGRDDRVRDYPLGSLLDSQSTELLRAAGAAFDYGMEAWVIRQAGGNPGILLLAASLGAELRQKAENFTVDVADALKKKVRRKLGDEAIESLQLLSLLTNVGIKEKPRQEIELICKWFGDTLQPQSVTKNLTRLADAGVVRVTGLYAEVIPPLFANALAVSALDGHFTKLLALFAALSQDGQFRLISRLRDLKGDEVDHFWNDLFCSDGLLRDFQSALSNIHLLRLVVGAVPNRVRVVRLIENGLQEMTIAQRLTITYSTRFSLLETLQELLFRRETSMKSLRCLIMLAEAEAENHHQSATSIFCDCFQALHTQFPLGLQKRLCLLKKMLSSDQSVQVRLLGVNAIKSSLNNQMRWQFQRNSSGSTPLDPPPHITWGEVWHYNDALLDLLMTLAQLEEPRLADTARSALPNAVAECAILKASPETDIAKIKTMVEWVLNHQVTLPVSDLAQALQRVHSVFSERRNKIDEEGAAKLQKYIEQIEALIGRLDGGDFSTQLRRWTGKWTIHQNAYKIDQEGKPVYRNEEELEKLAKQAIEYPNLLTNDLLEWLCSGDAREAQTFLFFFWLGKMDSRNKWLPIIDNIGATNKGIVAFSAYYGGLSKSNPKFINKRLDELTEARQVTPEAILYATRYLDGDFAGVKRMEKLIREERVHAVFVEQELKCGGWINSLSPDEYLRLIKVVAGSELENAAVVIEFFGMWLHSQLPIEGQLAEFAWQCLEAAPTITGTEDYDCDRLAAKLAESDIERGFRLLEKLLVQPCNCWNPINRYSQREFWKFLYSNDPERALRVPLSLALDNLSQPSSTIYHLHGVVDQEHDTDILIELALESKSQAELVCGIIKFEQPGFWRTVLKIIEKFPHDEGIKKALFCNSKQMLNDDAAPAAARPWLEELEQSLHEWKEERRFSEINREQNDRSQAVTDVITPQGRWAIKRLLQLGEFDKIKKLLSKDELQTILPKLQLSENELEEFRRKIENWK